jgi:hypothetical protein
LIKEIKVPLSSNRSWNISVNFVVVFYVIVFQPVVCVPLVVCGVSSGGVRGYWIIIYFINSIFKMLIALLKSFSIYLNVKKNIYKVHTKIIFYCSNINRNCSLSSNHDSWSNILICLNTWNGVSDQRN